MRYLLDTNIISNFTKPAPSPSLIAWMAEQSDDDLFIASLTVAEIRRGVLEKPAGKRRDQLDVWFSGPQGPQALFAGRVLPFDETAGLIWARLMADGKAGDARAAAWTSSSRPSPRPTPASLSRTTSAIRRNRDRQSDPRSDLMRANPFS
ncbi:MAG: PIN domain-containing protein [Acetobacteraceae bacterium]